MADIIGVMYILLDTARASDFAADNSQMLNLADTFVSSLQNDLQALQNALTESCIHSKVMSLFCVTSHWPAN
jgi:hypothetical protein